MANMISTLAILPIAFCWCEGYFHCRRIDVVQEELDVYRRIVCTFGSESREREGGREIPRNRAGSGQSRSNDADLVRAPIGADNLRSFRRVHGRKRTPGPSERSDSQSADGTSARTILQTASHRKDRRAGRKASQIMG